MSELGAQRPVTAYVAPMRAGRLLDGPLAAAHFVSLIEFERGVSGEGGALGADVWRTAHATLVTRRGDAEEHANLLCSLLLGFGLDAYVCLGTDGRGAHVWVMTRAGPGDDGVTFWEPLTGLRYGRSARPLPFATLCCAFNNKALYANLQRETSAAATSCALDDPTLWKALDAHLVKSLQPLPIAPLAPSRLPDRGALEERLEAEIISGIRTHRAQLGAPFEIDPQLSYLLAPALGSYEAERVTGSAVGASEFQQAIKRYVPVGHTFKGFPHHFTSVHPPAVLDALLKAAPCSDILQCRGDHVKLAVRARVYPYPDDVCAVWVMLAVSYLPTAA